MSRLSAVVNGSLIILTAVFLFSFARASVEVSGNHLVVDGKKQPQLFGAEVQYFRLRGGYGPNVPRARVLALWNKALDHFVQAKMNAVSFYIPWDFHEYAEGKFDFTGTADVDQDGRPDYPSRDLITFFKLLADRGITRIMVRPGPYINAEWGFLGFGAIPSWFHDKYPDSHMRTPHGLRSRLYDYHNRDLIRHSALWFKALHEQVLKEQMGPGRPVLFMQLDNETNYQWQSIYNHDFGQNSISRYQTFLKDLYQELGTLNETHGRKWERWKQIQPPMFQGRNIAEDQAWYRFADHSIFTFLYKIRSLWEQIGVREPQILFTLAESYNAPTNGILPNFALRNAKNATGLMTVNLYPKTAEDPKRPLLNQPFKADLDVKAADEANNYYLGSRQEWVLGPEIQGGWWRGIDVSPEARQQTYLTVLGHGMKALFVYYFNEGQNWDVEWSYNQIRPLYNDLRWERRLENVPAEELPEDFWNELQARSDRNILVGFDVRRIMKLGPYHDTELFFDAPLDGRATPRAHYHQLKKIGERIVAPYQDFLARSLEVHDDVALVKDNTSHQPVLDQNIPSVLASADWTGGLLGYLMNADINPRVLHGDISPGASFAEPKILVHLDTGLNAPRTLDMFKKAFARGQTTVNFLASDVPRALGVSVSSSLLIARKPGDPAPASVPLKFYITSDGQLTSAGARNSKAVAILSSAPVYQYELGNKEPGCEGILYLEDKVVGYRCKRGEGTVVQIGALVFEDYNSNAYAHMAAPLERERFLKALLAEAGVKPKIKVSDSALQAVAFARNDPERKHLWLTVKSGALVSQKISIKVSPDLLRASLKQDGSAASRGISRYRVKDLLSKKSQILDVLGLTERGIQVQLAPHGSGVYVLEALK